MICQMIIKYYIYKSLSNLTYNQQIASFNVHALMYPLLSSVDEHNNRRGNVMHCVILWCCAAMQENVIDMIDAVSFHVFSLYCSIS